MKENKFIFNQQNIIELFKNPFKIFEYSIFRYLFIGGITFAIDFGTYQLLISFLNWDEVQSNLVAVFISLFFNFSLSNSWTFKAGNDRKKEKLGKYAILATFNYIFNNLMFAYLVSNFNLHGLIAKVIVTLAVVCWNFVLYKTWIFKSE